MLCFGVSDCTRTVIPQQYKQRAERISPVSCVELQDLCVSGSTSIPKRSIPPRSTAGPSKKCRSEGSTHELTRSSPETATDTRDLFITNRLTDTSRNLGICTLELGKMGTLTGHMIPAFFFFTFGLWHLFSAAVNYLRHPRDYCARAWQPVPFVSGKLRSLELYVLLLTIPIAIFYELGISTSFSPLEDGIIPVYRIASFQHSVVLLMFWLFAALVLISESSSALPLPYEIPFVLIGLAFLVELTVIGQEASLNAGLEGKCYTLLSFVIGISSVCAFLLAWQPRAFFVDFMFCMSLLLQGTWLFQIGLSMYVEGFIPEGCHRLQDLPVGVNGSTQCDLEDAKLRARGLMAFAFNCHVTLVVLFGVCALGLVARLQGYRRGGYDPVNIDYDGDNHLQMKPLGNKLSFDRR